MDRKKRVMRVYYGFKWGGRRARIGRSVESVGWDATVDRAAERGTVER